MPNYRKTKRACYMGLITQAIAANFAPLLFLKFHNMRVFFEKTWENTFFYLITCKNALTFLLWRSTIKQSSVV